MIVQATVQLGISISQVDVFAQISNVTIGSTFSGTQFAAGAAGAISGALTVATAIGGCIEGYRDVMQASVTKIVDKVMGKSARSATAGSNSNNNGIDQKAVEVTYYLGSHFMDSPDGDLNKENIRKQLTTPIAVEIHDAIYKAAFETSVSVSSSGKAEKEALALIPSSYETEASGGITIDNIRPYAETGVQFISMGALTHSVKGLDLSLKASF